MTAPSTEVPAAAALVPPGLVAWVDASTAAATGDDGRAREKARAALQALALLLSLSLRRARVRAQAAFAEGRRP